MDRRLYHDDLRDSSHFVDVTTVAVVAAAAADDDDLDGIQRRRK